MIEVEAIVRADRKVKDATIRLQTLNASVVAIDREIASLDAMETELIRNLDLLKDDGIITVAQQYKKSKDALASARARRSFLRIEKDNQEMATRQMASYLEQFKRELDLAIKGPKSNVIYGKFGKDRG